MLISSVALERRQFGVSLLQSIVVNVIYVNRQKYVTRAFLRDTEVRV